MKGAKGMSCFTDFTVIESNLESPTQGLSYNRTSCFNNTTPLIKGMDRMDHDDPINESEDFNVTVAKEYGILNKLMDGGPQF